MLCTQYHLPDYLREGYAAVVKNSCELLRFASQEVTPANLVRLVDSIPRDPADVHREDFKQDSYRYKLLKSMMYSDDARLSLLCEYFFLHLPGLHRGARKMLEEALFGILITFEQETKAVENKPEPEEPLIPFACEACGEEYQVSPEHQGKRSRCKKCGHEATIPTGVSAELTTITCESCKTALNLPPGAEERRVKCPQCGHKMTVPARA